MMRRLVFGILGALVMASPAMAQPHSFPSAFQTQEVPAEGARLYVRVGGAGPAVVLLHGFGDTGDMWAPLAAELARDHRVVVPDLRGMGLSSQPADGYDKWTQAGDIRAVLTQLGIGRATIIGHDIGTMVAFAYAARYRADTERLVVMDAPVPGVPPWDDILRDPRLWHFDFGGPDMERLVAGRERIYLDRFWNEFAADPSRFDEAARRHYAVLYARPGAMHAAFPVPVPPAGCGAEQKRHRREAHHSGPGHRRGEILRRDAGGRHEERRDQRDAGGHPRCRPLADGGAAGRHDRSDPGFPPDLTLTAADAEKRDERVARDATCHSARPGSPAPSEICSPPSPGVAIKLRTMRVSVVP